MRPHDPIHEVNGHHSLWLLLDRLDRKMDAVLGRLGQGEEVMSRLRSETDATRDRIDTLSSRITRMEGEGPRQPSGRARRLLDIMREIMPLKEWIFGALLIASSLLGLQMSTEVRTAIVSVISRAGGG